MEHPPVVGPGLDLTQLHSVGRRHPADHPSQVVEKLPFASEVVLIEADEARVARTHILLDSHHFSRVDELNLGKHGASLGKHGELPLQRSFLPFEKRRHQCQREKREEGNAQSGDPSRPPHRGNSAGFHGGS